MTLGRCPLSIFCSRREVPRFVFKNRVLTVAGPFPGRRGRGQERVESLYTPDFESLYTPDLRFRDAGGRDAVLLELEPTSRPLAGPPLIFFFITLKPRVE